MVKLIEKIEEKIREVLEKLRLRPKEDPGQFILRTKGKKHRFSTICENEKGKKFIFYARLHDSKSERERMIAEVKLAKALIKKRVKFFPKYFLAEIEKDFEWILREYFKEETLESKKEIERLARPLKEKEVFEIAKIIIKMQNLKFPFLKAKELKKIFLLPKEMENRGFSKKDCQRVKEILKKNREFLIKENKYFCHGDFQIGNLIFTKDGLKIIDLESAQISNFAFDPCFFWMRLWREKALRRKFLKIFCSLLPKRKFENFKILFQIDAIFLAFHSFCARPTEYSKRMLSKRKKYFLKVLKNAILGFDFIKDL